MQVYLYHCTTVLLHTLYHCTIVYNKAIKQQNIAYTNTTKPKNIQIYSPNMQIVENDKRVHNTNTKPHSPPLKYTQTFLYTPNLPFSIVQTIQYMHIPIVQY